jgi:hypothetical protein
MNLRSALPVCLFLFLALAANAQLFVGASGLYTLVHGAGMDGKKDAVGGAVDLGWQIGKQHALVISMQSSRWSGAYQDELYTVYGSGEGRDHFRTTLEAITAGYQFTVPLSAKWSWQITPAMGVGRLKTEYDSTIYQDIKVLPPTRVQLGGNSQFCAQLSTGLQCRFSSHSFLHITARLLQKNRDPEAYQTSNRLSAVQLAAGMGFNF